VRAGNLVRVKFTDSGDNKWVVRLYRGRTPVLLLEHDTPWGTILHEGRHKYIRLRQLEAIDEGR
jgi:hypothetical protein